ncbi:MAG: winged helix-turn-helix domain-containing protein [Luteimonas sp.]
MTEAAIRHYRFETYRLDTQTRELRDGDGPPVPLTAKAFDTLRFLIENRHRIVGKDELLDNVWAGRVVEENNLTQAVSTLRRALGSGAGDHRYVVTVPGRGYQFVAEVREDDPGSIERPLSAIDSESDGSTMPQMTVGRRMITVGALLFVLGLFAAVAWRMREATPASSPMQSSPVQSSLAVLPFRSLNSGPRDELLELGLADTLITRISSSTSLRVRSLSSSQRFAGAKQDPIDAGRQLGATYVVDGTIQRSGDRVRVSTRLADVRGDRTLWSGTFDENINHVFTLQDNIAAALATALELKASALPARGRSPCDGANAEAYRAYLTGSYQLDRPSGARMREALAAFRRAIDLDPTCARAYAGMAYAYRALVMTADEDPRENFPLAQAAVKQALAIDPGSAEAYSSQGFIRFWYDWDWAGAEVSFKRAIALNPSLPQAHMAYAHLLANIGRGEEAVSQAREAVALDPLSPLINTLTSTFISGAGHADEGRRGFEKALALDPDFWVALLGGSGAKIQQHDYAGAIADLRRARDLSGDSSQVLTVLGQVYVLAGQRGAAAQILRDMQRRDRDGYIPATSLAKLENALGHPDAALDLLERAYHERDVRLTFLRIDGAWNNLRAQPRFQALMQRMAFPPVAAASPLDSRAQKNQESDSHTVRGGP